MNVAQAELLLNHADVRTVDLTPTSGIGYQQLNRDIENLPGQIPHPSTQAARVCILDSGINTNHPLFAPAIAGSESYVEGEEPFDQVGHGTAVAGIVLYGDLEACNASNFWQPELWLFNARILDKDAEFDDRTIEKTIKNSAASNRVLRAKSAIALRCSDENLQNFRTNSAALI